MNSVFFAGAGTLPLGRRILATWFTGGVRAPLLPTPSGSSVSIPLRPSLGTFSSLGNEEPQETPTCRATVTTVAPPPNARQLCAVGDR
jgi:hypothetical protein